MVVFTCEMCGKCCHEYPFVGEHDFKRIPVFPEELDVLEEHAVRNNVPVKFLEDIVFPDLVNKRIMVITYKIVLDNEEKVCPFFSRDSGCTVNESKPLACKAYPIARKKIDAYHESIELDPYCTFIENKTNQIKSMNQHEIGAAFPSEDVHSKKLMEKNQGIILCIKQLTAEGRISIPDTVEPDMFSECLRSWDREYLSDFA